MQAKKIEWTPGRIVLAMLLIGLIVGGAGASVAGGAGEGVNGINVIGSQETCHAVRATITDPTESCTGPFYFRRDDK
jgi:hypothetical protein